MSKIHIAESTHYYYKSGTPAYTIVGANGKERPTTLRDARKLNLVPSVTQIIGMAARPGLEAWKQDQTILACLTMPCRPGETDTEYVARIKEDAKAQATKAAERGTQIHAWVQQGFEGKYEPVRQTMIDLNDERLRFYDSTRKTLTTNCGTQQWVVEKSFANESCGGKIDLHCFDFLVDIKTTEKSLVDIKIWDEHAQQLAAYRMGLALNLNQKCGILYINVNTAESRLIWIPEKELKKGLDCFMALLNYWYSKTGLGDEK